MVLDFPDVVDARLVGQLNLVQRVGQHPIRILWLPRPGQLVLVEDPEPHATASSLAGRSPGAGETDRGKAPAMPTDTLASSQRIEQGQSGGPAGSLQWRDVVAGPVHLKPGYGGGPRPGHLKQPDGHQQQAADPGDRPGVPPGEGEHGDAALDREGDQQERNPDTQAVDEGKGGPADRSARGRTQQQDRAQRRADAGSPAQAEQDAEQRRAGQPDPRPDRRPDDPASEAEPVEYSGE